jgi:hypothetical protein
MTEEVYNDYCQEASTHTTRKRLRVDYDIYGQSMQAASLQHHLETQHNVYHSFVPNRDLEGECLLATFRADDEDSKTGLYCCPVPGCFGGAPTHFRRLPGRNFDPKFQVLTPSFELPAKTIVRINICPRPARSGVAIKPQQWARCQLLTPSFKLTQFLPLFPLPLTTAMADGTIGTHPPRGIGSIIIMKHRLHNRGSMLQLESIQRQGEKDDFSLVIGVGYYAAPSSEKRVI